jgi:hypothetical protein
MDFLTEVRSGDHAAYRGEEALTRAIIVDACYVSARDRCEVLI